MTTFDEYYGDIYGERWPDLREGLEGPPRHVAMVNPFVDDARQWLPDGAEEVDGLEGCFALAPDESFERPGETPVVPNPYYLLDGASVAAGRVLEVEPGDRVVDMCAAPGGKSLVAAFELGASGMLVANDVSSKRRKRLRNVIEGFLPEEVRRHVAVRPYNAAKWGTHQQDAFDRVLVDAPCSGEAYLVDDPDRLDSWSTARSDQLAQRQFALLCAALDVVRPGGRVVYSTCSISPVENDGVVEEMVERRGDRLELVDPSLPFGESTEYGEAIRPDETPWGPMYVAAFVKRDPDE